MTKEQLTYRLSMMKGGFEKEIAKFQAKLAKEPAHAFSWADSAMEAAAKLYICDTIIPHLEKDTATVESVYDFTLSKVLHSARYPASSSSEVSNAMERKISAAWAEVLYMLQ